MIWILSGVLTGLLMGLWEYFFLAFTVEGFSSGGELLVFVSGLVSGMVILGGALGGVFFLALLPPRYLFSKLGTKKTKRTNETEKTTGAFLGFLSKVQVFFERVYGGVYRRVFSGSLAFIIIGSLGWVGVGIGFLINAFFYHRLYLSYHVLLSGLTFFAGFIGSACFIVLMRRRVQEEAVFRLWIVFGGVASFIIGGAFFSTPRLVYNENLKAIVADRGITSAHIFIGLSKLHDKDGDGFAIPPFGYDCDDHNPKRHPMRYDIPGDGIDQSCTGADRSPSPPFPEAPSSFPAESSGRLAPYVSPKRILIITIEALRADRWPLYTKRRLLPNVYKLSRLGFAFHRAYTTSNWTIPSVYSLMTGMYPSHVKFVMGMLDQKDNVALIDPESSFARKRQNMRKLIPVPATDKSPTLAEELKKRGFLTATVIDIPFLKREMGMARGFDIVDETPYKRANRSLGGITSPLMAKHALKILRKHRKNRLFLYLHFSDPHAPYHKQDTPTDLGDSPEDRYDSEVRFVDGWIGYMLTNLQKEGLLEDTLFVITADHGQEFYDHGGRYHATTVYEELIRVPLVFAGPGIRRHVTIQPVSLVDVLPTVLSLVDGAQDRHTTAGVDLSRWLRTPRMPAKLDGRVMYSESRRFGNWKQAAIGNRYKLIRDNKSGTSMLFDLHRDRLEKHNLIGKKPETAKALLRRMNTILNQ